MVNFAKRPAKARRVGAAEAFCEDRLAVGRFTTSLEDLIEATGLSAIAAKRQMSRLRGKVVKVSSRRQFYLLVSPEHRGVGAPPPAWWLEAYFKWLGRPYYLALLSAASLFGSNPQAIQLTQVMTDRPLRAINLGRIRVRFFVKHGLERTPTLQPAGMVAPLHVSTPEATAYDLIRYEARIGGIERAAETIRPLLPMLRARELKRVLDSQDEPVVAQRLGFVIEACGEKSLARTVRNWLPDSLAPVALTPARGSLKTLSLVKRWQLYNNSAELRT